MLNNIYYSDADVQKKNEDGQTLHIIMRATETFSPAIHQPPDSQEEISTQMLLIEPPRYKSSIFYIRNQRSSKKVLQTKDSATIM
jgi:hypothetical protein